MLNYKQSDKLELIILPLDRLGLILKYVLGFMFTVKTCSWYLLTDTFVCAHFIKIKS